MGQLPPVRRQILTSGPSDLARTVWTEAIATWLGSTDATIEGPRADGSLVHRLGAGRVEVTFTDVARGAATLVTVHHDGFEAGDAAARDHHQRAWPAVLARFAESVAARATATSTIQGPHWLILAYTVSPGGPTGTDTFADPRFGLHVDFLRRLASEGVLVASGTLPDAADNGMTIIRVQTLDDVARYLRLAQDEDGSVTEGLLLLRARPWAVALTG